jgi:type I restriction enzyme M protein
VVIDTGAASRGSGNENENKEKLIRQWFVEHDLIEGVILLPDNLFYNTTAAGLIIILNCKKTKERKGKIILINAGLEFLKGRPKNYITTEGIKKISDAFHTGKDLEKFVKVVPIEQIAKNDFNLSPSRYIETTAATEHRDVQTILDELAKLDTESKQLDGELKGIFTGLGYKVPSPPAIRHSRESGNPGGG